MAALVVRRLLIDQTPRPFRDPGEGGLLPLGSLLAVFNQFFKNNFMFCARLPNRYGEAFPPVTVSPGDSHGARSDRTYHCTVVRAVVSGFLEFTATELIPVFVTEHDIVQLF